MLDDLTQARAISVASETHPLCRDVIYRDVRAGASVAEIVRLMDLDTARYGLPYVLLTRGTEVWPVPITLWKNVRPKDGTRVEIAFPAQEGGAEIAIAAIASAFLPSAAAAGAGALFTAGTVGYALTYAAITVVGALAINALIPPAQQGGSGAGPQNFAITGVGNAANRYGVFPYVIGRHRMFPPLTASGYSETVGRDIYYRGRMTFGWAPDGVALEDLRIGTTPITEFSGVELEFRNVDKARTLAAMPGLEALVALKTEESLAPKVLLSEVGEQYVYAPSAAAKSVSLTLEPTALYYLSGVTAVVEVEEGGSGTWTAVATYADLASAQTFSAGPFADGISRSWRVRLTAVTEAEVAPKVSRRRSSEGLTVTSASASYQQAEAGWRSGSETMRLYPRDVAEDGYSDVPQQDVPVVKYTRVETSSAAIDLSFPQGLYKTRSSGKVSGHGTDFQFEYQSTEGGFNEADWIDLGVDNIQAKSTTLFRWTKTLTFPEPGEYAIRITRRWLIDEDPGDVNTCTLTAIRSFRDGDLPSPEGIAEVAFRIKATDQLNGQVDSLNAIVQQLAPVWTGSGWTAPQPVRHPAWGFLQAIRGKHLRRPVRDERIDLEAFRAWATEEPHWTCDYVVDTATQLGEVLDIIAAAGRAKRTLTDLKWSIIRDNAAGPVRQVFTPRNSWGFKAEHRFPRKIHGFRVKARSERLEWQEDEILVLADGFTRQTATELETLDLPGVVVTAEDEDEGNVYRLGRYHLATALNRPATYTLQVGWEHLRVTRGDKVRFVHDVPLIGVGQARIKAITVGGDGFVDSLALDDVFDFDQDSFRMLVRNVGGNQSFTALSPINPQTRDWTPATNVAAGDVAVGDLVIVEELMQESVDLIVTSVRPKPDESAELQLVDAVPAILDADSGTIPPYSPVITEPRDPATAGLPPAPVVISAYSSSLTQLVQPDLSVRPRIAVQLAPFVTGAAAEGMTLQLRWSDAEAEAAWVYGEKVAAGEYTLLTGALEEGESYRVEVSAVGADGKTRGWVSAGVVTATTAAPTPSLIDATFTATTVKDGGGTDRRPAIALSWTPAFAGAKAVAWKIRPLGQGETKGQVLDVSLGSALILEVLPATVYECSASFLSGANVYQWSAWQQVTTPDIRLGVGDVDPEVVNGNWEVPDVPTGLALMSVPGADGLSKLVVDWGDVAPSTGYDLELSIDAGLPTTWRLTGSRYEDFAVPGTGLSARVRAVNGPEVSAWSTAVTHTVATDNIPPAAPTGLTAQAGFGAMWLNWEENTEADMSHYEIAERGDTAASTDADVIASAFGNAMTRTGLGNEVTKYYRVRAVDTSGNKSGWSNLASDTTPVKEAVTTEDIEGLVDSTSFASGIVPVELFATLPTTGNFEGRQVSLTTTGKLYRYHDGAWTAATDASDIEGAITDAQIEGLSANKIGGQLTDGQIADLDAAKLTGQIAETQIAPEAITTPKLQSGAVETGKLAAGAVTTTKLAVGGGKNLLSNTEFLEGLKDWTTVISEPLQAHTGVRIRQQGESWAGKTYPTYEISQGDGGPDDTDTTSYVLFRQAVLKGPDMAGQTWLGQPAEPGKTYEVSVQVSTHRCTAVLYLQFLDVDGAHLAYSIPAAIPELASSSINPSEWPRYVARAVAPAGTARVNITLRKNNRRAGTTSAYVFVYRPQVCETVPNATEVTPYSVGGSTFIDGNQVITDTIAARHIIAGAIDTVHLAADAVEADNIKAGAVLTSKLVVSDSSNLVPNWNMLDNADAWGEGTAVVTYGYNFNQVAPWESQGTVYMSGDADAYGVLNSELFAVQGGQELYLSYQARVDTSTPSGVGTAFMQVQFFSKRDLSTQVGGSTAAGLVTHGQGLQKREGSTVVPATARFARVQLIKGNNGTTAVAIGSPVVRLKAGAALIVDGAIVTSKLAAGAVKAGQLSAGAVVTSKLGVMDLDNLWAFGNWSEENLPEQFESSIPTGGTVYCHPTVKSSGAFALILQKPNGDYTGSVSCRTPNDATDSALLAPVRAGQSYWFETEARASAAIGAGFYARIRWFDVNKQYMDFSNLVSNTGLATGWTRFQSQFTAPAGAFYAGFELYNHSTQTTAAWIAVDRIVLRKANAAELVVDGTIKGNHLVTNAAVITGTAQIADAVISTAKIGDLQVTGAKIANATIGSAKISDLTADKVTVSGGTKLSDWRGADQTKIAGGEIETNSVKTDSLKVGDTRNQIRNGDLAERTLTPGKYFRGINGNLSWNATATPWNNVQPLQFTRTSGLGTYSAIYPLERNAAEWLPVEHGSAVAYDVVARAPAGQDWPAGFYIIIDCYSGDKTTSTGSLQPVSNSALGAGWQRFQGTVQLPAGTAFVRMRILNHSSNAVSDILFIAYMRLALAAKSVDIQDGAITAEKITVSQLSAVSATVGILRTATSGARLEIRNNQILVYDASNVLRVKIGQL